MRLYYFLFFLSCHLVPANAVVSLHGEGQIISGGAHLTYFEDSQHLASIDSVSSGTYQFRPLPTRHPNFGYSRSHYWFHFQLNNPKLIPKRIYLQINYPLLDYITLYFIENNKMIQQAMGDKLPFSQRGVDYHLFVFDINVPPGTHDYYLQVSSTGPIDFALKVSEPELFWKENSLSHFFQGIFYGAMLTMFFYNLFLYFSIRDITYLYYVLFIISNTLVLFTFNGFAFQYIFPEQPLWAEQFIPIIILITIVLGLQFSRTYLNSRVIIPRMDGLLKLLLTFGGVILLSIFVFSYAIVIQILSIYILIIVSVGILSGATAWWMGYRPAKYYLMAWGILFSGILITIIRNFGFLPYNLLTQWAMNVTAVFEVLFLSFGLGNRIKVIQEKSDEILREQEVIRHSSEAKSLFLATMSHEIRTPMNGIQGTIELLSRTLLDTHQKKHLTILDESCDHLLTIINDILDFSKIEAGKMMIVLKPAHIEPIIQSTVALFAAKYAEKEIALNYHFANKIPSVEIDQTRLKQVLSNLLSNALKFTAHGEVYIKITLLENTEKSCKIQFMVKDTGIGIDSEKHHQLFLAFSQADNSIARHYGGTGLGLVICERMVALMGGKIWFESNEKQGSTFYFTLQANKVDESIILDLDTKSPINLDTLTWQRLRCLIVEDNEINQYILIAMLNSLGCEPDCADDGEIALTLTDRKNYDVIFMDMASFF